MIELLNFSQICDRFIEAYVQEFGERKFRTIADKIMTSDKVSGFISKSRYQQWRPNPKTFLDCLHEIPYFMFSKNPTMALAGLLTVIRWNTEANLSPRIASEDHLKEMVLFILIELRCTNI